MKSFNLGLVVIAIASRWWLLTLFLAGIAGIMAFLKQWGSQPFQWTYVFVSAIWGAGAGLLCYTSTIKFANGIAATLVSGCLLSAIAGISGLILDWNLTRTVATAAVGFVLGATASKWIPHLNLG